MNGGRTGSTAWWFPLDRWTLVPPEGKWASTDQLLQVILRGAHIFQLLRAGNLAFDGDRAAIVDFFQALEDAREIDFTFADGDFIAKVMRIGGPQAILGVDALDVRREEFNGVYRIGFAIEDEIGEIKIDALIFQADVVDGANQRNRGFLSGFVAEVLAITAAVFGDFAHGGDGFLVERIVGIFGDEPAMSLHGGNVAADSEIRRGFEVGDAGRAGVARNEADGQGAVVEIPGFLAGTADDQGSGFNAGAVERLAKRFGEGRLKVVLHVNLAGGDAEVLEFGHGGIGIWLDAEDEAEAERLFALVGGDDGSGLIVVVH